MKYVSSRGQESHLTFEQVLFSGTFKFTFFLSLSTWDFKKFKGVGVKIPFHVFTTSKPKQFVFVCVGGGMGNLSKDNPTPFYLLRIYAPPPPDFWSPVWIFICFVDFQAMPEMGDYIFLRRFLYFQRMKLNNFQACHTQTWWKRSCPSSYQKKKFLKKILIKLLTMHLRNSQVDKYLIKVDFFH